MRAASLAALVLGAAVLLSACADDQLTQATSAESSYRQGVAAVKAGDWVKAEQFLQAALAKTPDDPYVVFNLGVAWQHLGKFAQAREAYQRVQSLGAKTAPQSVSDPRFAGQSLADLATINLRTLPK